MTTAQQSPDDLKPQDFVYAGFRKFADGTKTICLYPIAGDGTLERERYFDWKKEHRGFIIGGIYTNVELSLTKVRGLPGAKWTGKRWTDRTAVIVWESLESQSEQEFRMDKLEKDARKNSELEELLLPLRIEYEKLRKSGRFTESSALVEYVQRVLRKKPTKEEMGE